MRIWTLGGPVVAGAFALALGACGGSEQASIPPVAPVVQPAPQPDMFASVPAEGADTDSAQGAGDTGSADQAKPDEGKVDQGKPAGDKANGADKKGDKPDATKGAKKEDAKGAKAAKHKKHPHGAKKKKKK